MARIDKIVAAARHHLADGEEILAQVMGSYECKRFGADSARTGVFLATDRRLVFFAKKMTGFDMEEFPYNKLSSLEMGKGLLGHKISFFASGNKAVMKFIKVGDVPAFVDTVRKHLESANAPSPPAPAPSSTGGAGDSIPDQIKKLAELHDAGILNDDEFSTKKAELLSRM